MKAPQFIFDLLDGELRRCQIELLEKVAAKYGLECEELVREFVPMPTTTLVPASDVEITIHKKWKPKPIPPASERCLARIWNRGRGGQCTRPKKSEKSECYCIYHEKHRRYGDIREAPDLSQFPKKHSVLYK